MLKLGCDDWRMLSQEFKDRDTSYVLTAMMIHKEIFSNSRNATIKNGRIAAAKRATEKLEKIGIQAFYEICNCETIRENARIEMEKITEKNKEFRKLKKRGFVQDEVKNKEDQEEELAASGETMEEQTLGAQRNMDERFIDLDLHAKKGSIQDTPRPKTNGLAKNKSDGEPLDTVDQRLLALTIQAQELSDDDRI